MSSRMATVTNDIGIMGLGVMGSNLALIWSAGPEG